MKKILFVIGSLDNGGAERVVALLSSELSHLGYEVSIITIIKNNISYEINENVKIIPISITGSGIRRNFSRLKELRNTVKDNDVIISFLSTVNIATLISSVGLNKKIILSERNDPAKEPGTKAGRLFRNLLYLLNKKCEFVFQTEEAAKYFNSEIQKRSAIIPNPLSKLPQPYCGIRKRNIVTIARLGPQKNLSLLIRCFFNIQKIYPDYKLDIYGQGPLKKELERQATELGIKDKVNFHGFVRNVHNEILNAGLYVMSSDYEGISNGMLEAIGLGLPVIATDCPIGGARTVIKNNVNGILVPVNDEKAMTRRMLDVIENPSLSLSMSKNAVKIRESLSLENITQQWYKIIEE